MKLLLFDVDGTLVLTGGAGLRALDRAFEKRRGVRGVSAGMRLAGRTDLAIVSDLYARHDGTDPDGTEMEAFLAAYLPFLDEEVAASTGYQLLPGLPTVLDTLRVKGHVLGLATGNVRMGARHKLTRGDLWHHFPFGGFGDDSRDRANLVRIASERAPRRFAPEDTWVIGDTPLDIDAARVAGFRALAVSTGIHGGEELEAARPDLLLPTLENLPDAL